MCGDAITRSQSEDPKERRRSAKVYRIIIRCVCVNQPLKLDASFFSCTRPLQRSPGPLKKQSHTHDVDATVDGERDNDDGDGRRDSLSGRAGGAFLFFPAALCLSCRLQERDGDDDEDGGRGLQ